MDLFQAEILGSYGNFWLSILIKSKLKFQGHSQACKNSVPSVPPVSRSDQP